MIGQLFAATLTVVNPPAPSFISVGSYQVPAQLVHLGEQVVRVSSGSVQPSPFVPTIVRSRCGSCNTQSQWPRGILGVFMCKKCEPRHMSRCLAKWGRAPKADEVYCLGCATIRLTTDFPVPDLDGHRRGRCKVCRRVQVAAAEKRYRRKLKRYG